MVDLPTHVRELLELIAAMPGAARRPGRMMLGDAVTLTPQDKEDIKAFLKRL